MKVRRRKVRRSWFHTILEFLRKLRDAWRRLLGTPTPKPAPRKAAPFCTVCGERRRPWDPDDDTNHAHGGKPPTE